MRILLGAVIALVVTVGFGSSEVFAQTPPATTTTTTTPTATPPAVPDAAAFRDGLLTLALANLDAQEASNFTGFFPAWRTAYPGLGGDGLGISSTPGRVSIYYNLLDSKDPGSPTNPKLIAFAVSDTQGRCAGAVIYGFPKTDKNQKFAITSGPCSAGNVVASFRAVFAVTPPPITTVPATSTVVSETAVPRPPSVGNSQPVTGQPLPWSAAAVFLLGVFASGIAGIAARRVLPVSNR